MIFKEEKRDLFTVPEDYYLAYCISADFGMDKGIAVEFNKKFDMKNKLNKKYTDYLNSHKDILHKPNFADCLLEDNVLNLVTKERYWQKPTYRSLTSALLSMRAICVSENIKKIAMPKIGCGLDGLQWKKVAELIDDVFRGLNIEILVCYI